MNASTFPRAAVLVLLLLGGCATTETASTSPTPDATGWLMSSGKEPTRAEFTALAATCETRAGPTEDCLINLGMKRAK